MITMDEQDSGEHDTWGVNLSMQFLLESGSNLEFIKHSDFSVLHNICTIVYIQLHIHMHMNAVKSFVLLWNHRDNKKFMIRISCFKKMSKQPWWFAVTMEEVSRSNLKQLQWVDMVKITRPTIVKITLAVTFYAVMVMVTRFFYREIVNHSLDQS